MVYATYMAKNSARKRKNKNKGKNQQQQNRAIKKNKSEKILDDGPKGYEVADDGSILIVAAPAPTYKVSLVGELYKVRPIKSSLGMTLQARSQRAGEDGKKVSAVIMSIIDMMFSKKDAKEVRARLKDPFDELDVDHITSLMMALMEKQTGNPTM